MSIIYEKFTHCYPVQKTLRFALIPQGKTEENIQNYGMLCKDEEKAAYYPAAKEIFDMYHKAYIEESLASFVADWTELFDVFERYTHNKLDNEKEYSDISSKYQKRLSDHLKKKLGDLAPEKLIKNALSDTPEIPLSKEQVDNISVFAGFATYFEGYRIIRENMYSADIASSVAYRIVKENFPKFYWNCKAYKSLNDELKELCNAQLTKLSASLSLDMLFSPSYFGSVLNQSGIDFYNTVLGGKTDSETSKIQGINELCNLAYQKGDISEKKKFSPLYKQILSDRESASFIPTPYESDEDVKKGLFTLCEYILEQNISELNSVFYSTSVDHSKIHVDKKQLSILSQVLYEGDWNFINKAIYDYCIKQWGETASKKIEAYIQKKNIYSLLELETILETNEILPRTWKYISDKYDAFLHVYLREKDMIEKFNEPIFL